MALPLLFKLNPRAMSACWSIALCTMFIVASFTLASGLRNSATVLKEAFPEEYDLISHPSGDALEAFEGSALGAAGPRAALGLFCDAYIEPKATSVGVFAIEDPHRVLPTSIPSMTGDSVLVGPDVPLAPGTTELNISGLNVTIEGKLSAPMFSPDWILGSEELLRQLTGAQTGFTFAIARNLTASERAALVADGFQVHPMVGIIEFLEFSEQEATSDSYWILLPSTFAIAILAYGFVGSEATDRRHDIGIVKTLGAGRRTVFRLIMADALIISVMGGLLGLALGIVVSYGAATVASDIFSAVLVIKIGELLLLGALAATVAAALVGAAIPALRMTTTRPESDLREVPE